MTPSSNKLEGLQVLRAIAALSVMVCHLKSSMLVPPANFLGIPWDATRLGAIGVDIFFVISGFVIAMTGSRLGNDWRAFLSLRVARIVPLYFVLSTYALLEAVISARVHQAPLLLSWRNVFNTYAFIPLFNGGNWIGPILGAGWTLCFEMWFYLCFATLMRYSGGMLAGTRLPYILGVAVAAKMLFLPSMAWGLPNFLFHPLTLEFCAGCLLYHFRNHIGKVMIYGMAVAAITLLFFAYRAPALSYDGYVLTFPVSGLHRALLWGGFAFCLVGLVTQLDLKYQWAWPRWLVLLGDASYSIYLIPGIFLMTFDIARHAISKLAGHEVMPMTGLGRAAFWVAGTIVCSILTWKYFEVPATRLMKRFLLRSFANRPPVNQPGTAAALGGDLTSNGNRPGFL